MVAPMTSAPPASNPQAPATNAPIRGSFATPGECGRWIRNPGEVRLSRCPRFVRLRGTNSVAARSSIVSRQLLHDVCEIAMHVISTSAGRWEFDQTGLGPEPGWGNRDRCGTDGVRS